MKAVDICRRAAELVGGDRESSHGDKLTNHRAIAAVWNGYLLARTVSGKPEALGAEDVATLCELLKIARRLNGHFNADDYIDGAGYAAVAGEIAARHLSAAEQNRQPAAGADADHQDAEIRLSALKGTHASDHHQQRQQQQPEKIVARHGRGAS